VLLRVARLRTLPPYSGGLWCCHMSRGSGPRLPTREGSGAATCPMTSDPTSLLGRAPVLPRAHGFRPCLPTRGRGGGSDVVMCPAIFKGSRALSIKKSVVVTACNKAHVFPRHDRTLPRRLQNVRTYGVIMTYKLCRQALQHRATMHHRAADRSWAWWAEATIRQDGATLGYDPTG
jgi:hypothetical protein